MKDSLFQDYKIEIVDKKYDGIIAIGCTHLRNNISFIVFSVYLPPESSPWGRNAPGFFNNLLQLIYASSNVPYIYICSDFNCRMGNLLDTIPNIDNIKSREM